MDQQLIFTRGFLTKCIFGKITKVASVTSEAVGGHFLFGALTQKQSWLATSAAV